MDSAFAPEQQALKDSTRRLGEEDIAPIAEGADEPLMVRRGLMAILAESELLHRARGLRRHGRRGILIVCS